MSTKEKHSVGRLRPIVSLSLFFILSPTNEIQLGAHELINGTPLSPNC